MPRPPGAPANRSWSWGGVLLLLLLTMAASNLSRDVDGHGDNSGGTSLPPLPRPDNGDNVRPVPLWEREFCRNAYDIPWETFCKNKRLIGLYRNVLDWDDSGALENFEEAKERFRAKYFGEGGPNNSNNNFHGGGSSSNLHQQGVGPGHTSSGTARMLIGSGTMWMSGAFTGGAMKWNGGGGGGGNGNGNGSGRNRNGGGGGGGSGRNWNCFGRGNRRNLHEGQHQQRSGGGMQRNEEEGAAPDEERRPAAAGPGEDEDGVASIAAQQVSQR